MPAVAALLSGGTEMWYTVVINVQIWKRGGTMVSSAKEKGFFDMTPEEIEAACKKAVAERDGNPTMDYVTRLDENTGRIIKKYKDGRIEYLL